MTNTMTIIQAVARAEQKLAKNDAIQLVSWATGKDYSYIVINKYDTLNTEQQATLEKAIFEHTELHKPLNYIYGSLPFLSLTLKVEPPILLPRPETEHWCFWLIERLKRLSHTDITIIDMCTGSGCIGLSLAQAFPQATVYLLDISEQACALAQKNAKENGITNAQVIQSDLFQALEGWKISADLIASNPPYISSTEWQSLDPSVKEWEDQKALIAAHDGLGLLQKISCQSKKWLKKNREFEKLAVPQLVLEIGHTQGDSIKEVLSTYDYSNIRVHQDLAGKDRFATANLL